MSEKTIKEIINESLSSLYRSGIIEEEIIPKNETVLMGLGSNLDSVAFVTLFMDMEDRIRENRKQDIFLTLDGIFDLNSDNKVLTVATFEAYIEKLLSEADGKI